MNFPTLSKNKFRYASKRGLRLALYICFCIVCIFWASFGANYYCHRAYTTLLSQNAAILTETSAAMQNLNQPTSIAPSKTSSTLPALVTEYRSLATQVAHTNLNDTNVLITGFYGLGNVNSLNMESAKQLDAMEASLTDTIDALTATRKFIEYDPATDLQLYVSGQETDASERLSRTEQGIHQVVADVDKAALPYSTDITALLLPLEKKSTDITPETANTWEEQVLDTQKEILLLIQKSQESSLVTTRSKIDLLAKEYLKLK